MGAKWFLKCYNFRMHPEPKNPREISEQAERERLSPYAQMAADSRVTNGIVVASMNINSIIAEILNEFQIAVLGRASKYNILFSVYIGALFNKILDDSDVSLFRGLF